MSLFVSKLCSVSVIITSNVDEKGRMDNEFYATMEFCNEFLYYNFTYLPLGLVFGVPQLPKTKYVVSDLHSVKGSLRSTPGVASQFAWHSSLHF